MLYLSHGSPNATIDDETLRTLLYEVFDRLGTRNRVVAVPPDMSRYHSRAGTLTQLTHHYYGDRLNMVLPAIGTHRAMTSAEIAKMYAGVPEKLFRTHEWKEDLSTLGVVPSEFVREISEGALDFEWPAQMNRRLVEDGYDLILSLGQVVPHEVIGMANYNKNLFIGTGGRDAINKSHYLSAVYGMERIMGRADTPVRRLLNYASDNFAAHLPIIYALTVIGTDLEGNQVLRGIFIGDDAECFQHAAALAAEVNVTKLPGSIEKAVVYLDPEEFKSTWIGNKAIYRTRMAIADGGELVVLAPGVREFGEDKGNDQVIRKYGYITSDQVLQLVPEREDLQQNLGAAAHLIHGSPEGRFSVTYCPGELSKEEIESVGYEYADVTEMLKHYPPEELVDGFNTVGGESIYYISKPALGLWSSLDRLP